MKNKSGITLVSLVLTVIILMILGSIIVYTGIEQVENAKEKKLLTELEIVNQAVFEAYTNYIKTKNDIHIVGEKVGKDMVEQIALSINVSLVNIPYDQEDILKQYYILRPDTLNKIGIYNSEDSYIVNYLTRRSN